MYAVVTQLANGKGFTVDTNQLFDEKKTTIKHLNISNEDALEMVIDHYEDSSESEGFRGELIIPFQGGRRNLTIQPGFVSQLIKNDGSPAETVTPDLAGLKQIFDWFNNLVI